MLNDSARCTIWPFSSLMSELRPLLSAFCSRIVSVSGIMSISYMSCIA